MRFLPPCLALLFVVALPTSGFTQGAVKVQDRSAGLQTAFARAQHLKRGINSLALVFAECAGLFGAAHRQRSPMPGHCADRAAGL